MRSRSNRPFPLVSGPFDDEQLAVDGAGEFNRTFAPGEDRWRYVSVI